MFDYEVIILPFLYVVSALAVLITLVRGIQRTETGTAEDGLATHRWGYNTRNLKIAGMILGVAAIIIPSLVVTPPGHRAAIYSMFGGVSTQERPEGLSLVFPYAQTPHQINVRTQKIEIEAFAQSKDLQEVTVKTSVNYHIDPTQAAELYDELGGNYEETVIAPAVLQRTDAEVGLIEALDFAAKRGELATSIQTALELQLGGYGIVVEYVNIEDAIFQSAFIASVEQKVIAGQTVETELRLVDAAQSIADQVVKAAEGEAAAIIAVANAQADANDVIDASLTNDVLLWQRINRWDGILPATLLSAGDDSLDVLIEIPAN